MLTTSRQQVSDNALCSSTLPCTSYLRNVTGWGALEQIAKFRLHVIHLVQSLNKLLGLV